MLRVFTIVANEVIGLSATECTLMQFSYNPEQIHDPESVLRSAVKDYRMMNSDILYGGGFSTCNITPRSEENRIEEFIANNDSQLEDNRRIPIKYIPEVYYGNKLIWKNPNFANT